MKFKLDENLPAGAARVLADAGHDVSTALQERLGGKPDSRIAETCKLEERALITLDYGWSRHTVSGSDPEMIDQ